jgi:hypothetical protein
MPDPIKITLGELKRAEVSLTKLMTADMPFKTSYRLRKLARKISEELMHIDKERDELIRKYGEKAANGQIVVPKGEKTQEFMSEYNMMLQTEATFDFAPIPLALIEHLSLSPDDLLNIEAFLEPELESAEKSNEKSAGPVEVTKV